MQGTVQISQCRTRWWTAAPVLLVAGLLLAACSSGPSATSSSTTTTSGPASSSTSSPVAGLGSYMPLYPFATASDAATWQQSYKSGGHDPWHLDAGQTAVSFAGWLGFTALDTVVSSPTDASGAHVTVGGHVPDSTTTYSAAVVHLVRWGTGSDAPWEVVGTDDTTFSLTMPSYAAGVSSPITAGGKISGVDENIRVAVRSLGSSAAVGTACCTPAGGDNSAWQLPVSFSAPSGTVLTVVASTGGHVAAVERFTVTGVRAA